MDYVERLIANGLTVRFQSNETNLSPSVPFLMSGQSLSALSFSTANDARKQIGTPDAADCKLAKTVLIRPYHEFTVGYTAQSPCNDPASPFTGMSGLRRTGCYGLLSFDFSSINRLVRRTSPRSCVHSDTMFPTTCPHLPSESIFK